jgi:hypothetical protein
LLQPDQAQFSANYNQQDEEREQNQ